MASVWASFSIIVLHQRGGLGHADRGRHGGVLGQRDQHVGQRADDRTEGLRQHDEPQDLGEVQPDGAGRLGLADGHRVDAGADRLADEGRGVGDEAEHRQPEALDVEVVRAPSVTPKMSARPSEVKTMMTVRGMFRTMLT